ncbi:MAG: hypothetical protein AB1553_01810 [Nitrospirota bacterium]
MSKDPIYTEEYMEARRAKPGDESRAIVLMIGDRFFCGFGKKDRVIVAWSLAGAWLFGSWDPDGIAKIESRITKRGITFERRIVSLEQ